jgi:hypothetical protein
MTEDGAEFPTSEIEPSNKDVTAKEDVPTIETRQLSPQEQAEKTLKEAFPSIDAAVVKAVLTASRGQIEPAFNALLGMEFLNELLQL